MRGRARAEAKAPAGISKIMAPREGVLVAGVEPGNRADESGLQPGDVILRIGGREISSPDDAASQLRAAEISHRQALPLLVMRNGTTSYLALDLRGRATGNG